MVVRSVRNEEMMTGPVVVVVADFKCIVSPRAVLGEASFRHEP